MSSSANVKQWTVGRQLGLIFVVVLALMAAVSGLGAWALDRTLNDLESLYRDRAEPLRQLGQVRYLGTRDRVILVDAISKASAELTARRLKEFDANRELAAREWKAYAATYMTDEEKGLAKVAVEAQTAFVEQALVPTARALRDGQYDEARALLDKKISALNPAFSDALDNLLDLQVREAARQHEGAEALGHRTLTVLAVLSVLGITIGAGSAWWFTRRLLRRLGAEPDELEAAAGRIARGELGSAGLARPAPAGSVMASMQTMRESLATIVSTVRDGVQGVVSASTQIAQGNADLSQRTEEQAASLEETAASMEQLTGTVQASSDNAQQARTLAGRASDVAGRGGEVVAQVVDTMQAIQGSSRKIADITGVIDGIAFQTNILALNAAVEAARAGEQGRGFAVVAGEVRALAQRSAEAAREIKQLIGESVGRIEQGGSLVADAGSTMQDIVGQVQRVSALIGEITVAAAEQNQGFAQVGEAVGQLDRTTQQNAALVEQSAAAAESLKQQADRLAQAVAVFRLV
ncbi:MAG: methyl-accepting chemotaxis protein [Rubrivivax sp.]